MDCLARKSVLTEAGLLCWLYDWHGETTVEELRDPAEVPPKIGNVARACVKANSEDA